VTLAGEPDPADPTGANDAAGPTDATSPTVASGSVGPIVTKEAAPEIRVPYPVYRAMRMLTHLINRAYWRVEVGGAAFPPRGPVIVAPVHRSFIDFFVVSEVTRRKIFFMTKEEMWHSRALGRFLDSTGAFPVKREGADRRSLARAQRVLESGEVLVLFPEGTRRFGTDVVDLHEGAAFLAARTGASIVPVGIGGTSESLPRGSKLPRPVAVELVVGAAIEPPDQRSGRRASRSALRDLTEQVRKELQGLYEEATARAAERRGDTEGRGRQSG
jgi:1-acyl-sn-glycerol-3-phosphate acyltransferase